MFKLFKGYQLVTSHSLNNISILALQKFIYGIWAQTSIVLWKMHTCLEARRVDSLNLVSTQCQCDGKSMRNQSHRRPFCSIGTYVNTYICMHKNVPHNAGAYVCVGVRVCVRVCAKNKQYLISDTWPFAFGIEFCGSSGFSHARK